MDHNLDHTIALLTRTPAALDALLRDLPAPWTLENEGPNTWSAYDVLGHLNHCERVDWMPRAQMILTHGETRAFEPLDRLAQQRESAGKSLPHSSTNSPNAAWPTSSTSAHSTLPRGNSPSAEPIPPSAPSLWRSSSPPGPRMT